jgi:hypothetical protein
MPNPLRADPLQVTSAPVLVEALQRLTRDRQKATRAQHSWHTRDSRRASPDPLVGQSPRGRNIVVSTVNNLNLGSSRRTALSSRYVRPAKCQASGLYSDLLMVHATGSHRLLSATSKSCLGYPKRSELCDQPLCVRGSGYPGSVPAPNRSWEL